MRTSQPGRWLAQTTEARPAPIVIFDTGTRLLLFLTSRCHSLVEQAYVCKKTDCPFRQSVANIGI